MTAQLRVAVLGTGFAGVLHARAARLAGAQLVGVAASSAERAREMADLLRADRAFDSADEAAVHDDVDVVHVCTPNHLHLPLAEAALRAGKHVVCEKPLATDLAGAVRLAGTAREVDRVAAVPFVYRYYPMVREARERVRAGETGALRLLHGGYLQDWLAASPDGHWRADPRLGGASRAFADIGSHWCDLVEFTSGHRIARLNARAFGAGDDAVSLQFETDAGALGTALVSQISTGRKNRLWFELDGADASVAFEQEQPEDLWVGRFDGATLVHRDAARLAPQAARLARTPAGHPQGYAECFEGFVADVYSAIAAGMAPDGLPVFADGLRTAQITDAVLSAARNGAWVAVPEPTLA